ncbi:HAD hydrolase-like protein [Amphritea sp. 2_MG-2023]|uniref:HAD family hydrolase n=1 Tax=Amphritea TaxID=515417 RepID=UPI001C07B9B5|nr:MULTISPECIES: HAD family hydrolase [Amphritea]MBU2964991.1 HAD hydrolase-like protein [Amphritea atlantica]MDO6418776.1 HAD hydrolase-like protein [Amphritea sp. 2_MG-2023]
MLNKYKTLVFDCDGVVLNSNKVKTEAFYQAALPYGQPAAQALVDFHLERGGISRYEKFEWFLSTVVPGVEGPDYKTLLKSYAEEVMHGLLRCEVADLALLRKKNLDANWLIVSGGDQDELRDIFNKRNLISFFDGGIFGSPDNKSEILEREIAAGNINYPALFLGDSQYDFESAKQAKLDFMFVSGWSEWGNALDSQKFFTFAVGSLSECI